MRLSYGYLYLCKKNKSLSSWRQSIKYMQGFQSRCAIPTHNWYFHDHPYAREQNTLTKKKKMKEFIKREYCIVDVQGQMTLMLNEVLALYENTSMDKSTWMSLKKNIKP